jgi:hypothetical protein
VTGPPDKDEGPTVAAAGLQGDQANGPRGAASFCSTSGLAAEINREHELACAHAGTAIEHARLAGALLLQVKDALPHGQFLPWIEENIAVTPRQAQRYMAAALGKPLPVRAIKSDTNVALDPRVDRRCPPEPQRAARVIRVVVSESAPQPVRVIPVAMSNGASQQPGIDSIAADHGRPRTPPSASMPKQHKQPKSTVDAAVKEMRHAAAHLRHFAEFCCSELDPVLAARGAPGVDPSELAQVNALLHVIDAWLDAFVRGLPQQGEAP